MHHDDRRVHAALVGIAQFGAEHARTLGRLKLHRFEQQACQHRRGHLAHGRFVGLCNRAPQRAQTLAFFGRNEMQCRKLQKRQTGFDRALQHFALVSVHRIPFVNRQHHCAATLQHITCNVRVLVGHPLGGIKQQQHHIGRLNRLQSFDHRKLFDGLKHFALAAQTCGVDEFKLLPIALERHTDGIPRGARHVESHQTLFTQPSVDEGRFAHIGATRHRQFDGAVVHGFGIVIDVWQMQRLKRQLHHAANALAVRRRHWKNLAQTEFVKLDQLQTLLHALSFVGHQQSGFAQTAQVVGNVMVLR